MDEEEEEDGKDDGFNMDAMLEALPAGNGVFDLDAVAEALPEIERVTVPPSDRRDPRERFMERPDGH